MATSTSTKFELGEKATIDLSDETGQVRGITTYFEGEYPPNYLLRYKAADGRIAEGWYTASFLRKVDAT